MPVIKAIKQSVAIGAEIKVTFDTPVPKNVVMYFKQLLSQTYPRVGTNTSMRPGNTIGGMTIFIDGANAMSIKDVEDKVQELWDKASKAKMMADLSKSKK